MLLILTGVFAVVLIAVGGGIICSKIMLERLLQFEYEHYRDAWRADGCPHDYDVPRISRFSSDEPENKGALKRWIRNLWFRTPGWVAAEPSCQRWLRAYRIASLVSFLAVIGSLLLVAGYCARSP